MKFVTRYLGTTCTAALLIAASAARAEDTPPPPPTTAEAAPTDDGALQEMIVTAQKRSENIQKVPVAVTAFSAETLTDLGVKDVNDLTGLAPSLQIKSADASANPKIFIRGVGSNDFNPTSTNAVGIYVDGAYIGSPLAQGGQFFDLERIEVLRGPQGTLYGRNTTGGAINIITAKPTQDLEGYASAEYGNYNTLNLEGAVSDAIVPDKLAVRVAATYARNDGFTENRFTGNDVNNTNKWAGRMTFLFTPNEDVEMLTQFHGGQNRNGAIMAQHRGDPYSTDYLGYADTDNDPYAGSYNREGTDAVDLLGGSNSLTWNLGAVSLISITAFDWSQRDDLEDTDASPNALLESHYKSLQNQLSQELRLQSNGDTRLKWVAGLYYAREYLKTNSDLDIYGIFGAYDPITGVDPITGDPIGTGIGNYSYPYTQTTNSYAIFGQTDYKVTEKLTATVGLRYSGDKKDIDYEVVGNYGADPLWNYSASKTFSAVSGRLGLSYQFNDDAQVYATYNRGFKSGGFFGGFTSSYKPLADTEPYKDETVNAYEIGTKTDFLGRKLRLNTAFFYNDYKDLQVYTIETIGTIPVQVLDNAPKAEMYGAEFEIMARPAEGLMVSVGASLLHATYKDYKSGSADYSGNTMTSSPKLTLNGTVNYDYALPGGDAIVTTVQANYRTKVYLDTSNREDLVQGGMLLLDGRLGWRSPDDRYELGLWGKNLLDKTYLVDTVPLAADFGFDALYYGDPRTFGVYFKTNF
ncbi:TonB-dependent receptor [Parvibaculum sp.]|uniref:TonB-dependent receptor n=1 Tax=Parvibaculum sp. TaxID=2024848 RepID=UPI002B6F83A5|nr:TonB-dependent receptor [Parvibaculum sp.]HUD51102.1 TonB-dependent receptor [Parvibaculum sp.]